MDNKIYLLNIELKEEYDIEIIENIILDMLHNIINYITVKNNENPIINCSFLMDDIKDIYIMVKFENDTKPKINVDIIKQKLKDELNTENIIINNKLLRHNYEDIEEYINKNLLNKYERQKDAIYKWREANKENYLIKQHQYHKKKFEDPEKRIANLKKIKERNKQKREEEQQRTGIIKKVGRPSKYNI